MGKVAVTLEHIDAIRDEVQILTDINLEFYHQKTTVIIGPSGCGKSTILKIAAGIVPPERGNVFIDGKNVLKIPDRDLVSLRKSHGFVFQDAALWANKTVAQNLSLPLQFHFQYLSNEEISRRVTKTLRLAGYQDEQSLKPDQLSAGERKMVSFARAIITEPQLVFLDDPTISVDREGVDKILAAIKKLKEEQKTLIVATHDPMLTSMIADYLVIVKQGKILESGSFHKVVRSDDREVIAILTDVLSQSSTYAGDILDLLGDDQ